MRISASNIAFVVPVGEKGEKHVLYLRNGYCVRISALTGKVYRTFRLPEEEEVEAKLKG